MTYRKDFRDAERDYYWSLPRVIVGAVAFFALAGVTTCAINIVSQPARVVTKTLDADNIINNYEWFHDAYGNYQARVSQVRQFKKLFADESDGIERNRLRIEMAAIQQSCRDLAQRYNQNADKSNRNIFMGRDVPSNLSPESCE